MTYKVVPKNELSHAQQGRYMEEEERKRRGLVNPYAPGWNKPVVNSKKPYVPSTGGDRATRSEEMAAQNYRNQINKYINTIETSTSQIETLKSKVKSAQVELKRLLKEYEDKGLAKKYGRFNVPSTYTGESWLSSLFHEDGWIKFDTSLSELQRKLGPRKLATGSGLKAQIKSIIASDLKDTRAGEIGLNPATDIDIKIEGDDIYYQINRTSLKKARGR